MLARLDTLTRTADIPELRRRLDRGEFTARQLTLFYLTRIRQYDGPLASVLELNPDVIADAQRLDRPRGAASRRGRLHGLPILLKDNISTGDRMHTTAGAIALAEHRAPVDAALTSRLRAEGALLLGKANLSEWAHFMSSRAPSGFSALGGQVVNPFGSALTVSGSSSGSAVATAARFAVAAIGTETTGSIIAPAAFNGVAGMRPTPGLVDTHGIIPITTAFDGAGPIARQVSDLAELLTAMSTSDNRQGIDFVESLDSSRLRGLRAGVVSLPDGPDDQHADALFSAALDDLRRLGATVVPSEVSRRARRRLRGVHRELLAGSMADDVARYLEASGAPVRSLAEIIAFNRVAPQRRAPHGQDLLQYALDNSLSSTRHRALSRAARQVAGNAVITTAHRVDADVLVSLDNTFSLFYALAGTPAVTVPIGLDARGQPHGMTFVGVRPGSDAEVLSLAYAFEQGSRRRVSPDQLLDAPPSESPADSVGSKSAGPAHPSSAHPSSAHPTPAHPTPAHSTAQTPAKR